MIGSGRVLLWAGIGLLLAGIIGYGAGFFYGLRFAYRPEDIPGWLDPLFPASIGAAVLGLVLCIASFLGRRERPE